MVRTRKTYVSTSVMARLRSSSIAFAVLLALLNLGGCSGEEDLGPPLPYARTGRPILPFPTDAVTVAADTPTGRRIDLGPKGMNLGDVDEAIYLLGEDFISTINEVDGWSTLAPVFAPLSEPADEGTVGHMILLDLDRKTVVPTEVSPIEGETEYGKHVNWLMARSPTPLEPATRHAITLMRGLETVDGERFSRPDSFDPGAVPGLEAALEENGRSIDDVLVSEVFTTQSIVEETTVLAEAMRSAPTPEIILDADEDGAPDIYLDPKTDPRGDIPDADYSGVRASVRIRFELPNYRVDLDGPLVLDHEKAERQGSEDVEALILIPEGEGPFPVVVFHHGIGNRKELAFEFAHGFAQAGVAVAAIDGALHGYRTDRPGNASTRFLNIADPGLIVDNFRQAETDQVYFVRVIDELAKMDLLGDGHPQLDSTRLFYVGESLGAIVGGAVIGIEPRFEGAVLLVGGGTLLEFFDRVLAGFQFDGFPTQLFTAVAQAAIDRGDPSNYARFSLEDQVLLIQGMEDTTVPAAASAALARAMALPQVNPVEPVPDLPTIDAPAERRGWTQHAGAGHNLFHEPALPAYDVARGQLFHFVSTWAETGVAEIQ